MFHLPSDKKLGLENGTKVEFELIKNPLHETYSKDPRHQKTLLKKMKVIQYLIDTRY